LQQVLRYFFEISYHGSAYHGWQAQNNAPSVQEAIEKALNRLLKRDVAIFGSGRTDTGVHAVQQYFHLDTDGALETGLLQYRLNSILDPTIAIHAIRPVRDGAHARFDAISRTYVYQICRRKDPFEFGRAYMFYKPLELDKMQIASSYLVGKHNFQAFSKVKTNVNHFICNVFESQWFLENNMLIYRVQADRFLRGMVRALVGTLLEIGEQKIAPEILQEIMEGRDRRRAGAAVPAEGLYLKGVGYPEEIFIE
jgi:tRNA pseudouridine38-40 synthase